jgi:uridylate kinase
LRGIEIEADLILKATKVDGVYSADPEINPDAVKYDTLSFDEVIEKKLAVMDLTAIFLSRDHNVPIKVFNMNKPGALLENILGDTDGTLIQ